MLKKYASGRVLEEEGDFPREPKTAAKQPEWSPQDTADLAKENEK